MNKIRKGDEVIVIAGRDKGKRGTVTLRGTVGSLDEKSAVCNAAWSAPGVRHVIDEMSVGPS